MKTQYIVYVDDNYHFMDETERYKGGTFDDCASAQSYCRQIVDACLQNAYRPGMTADELMAGYQAFGEDPWISTSDTDCQFSARTYAKQRSDMMCQNPS